MLVNVNEDVIEKKEATKGYEEGDETDGR